MTSDKIASAVDMMIRTDHMHRALIDTRARTIGIHRTQHRILMHLARQGTLPSQKDLAEHLDITPAAVTGALKKIEQDGYIERKLGHDNRFNELQITDRGREIVNETRQLFMETDRSIFEGFTDSELSTYITCLEKLQGNIKRHMCAQSSEERKENI